MSSLANTAPFLSTSSLPPAPLTSTDPLNNTLIGSKMPKQPTRNCRKTSRKSPIDGRNANNKRKAKQNKKPDSAYDSSTWETNVYCAVCNKGFWTMVLYLIHIYVKTTHYKQLDIVFECGYESEDKRKCGMKFRTADDCDNHSKIHEGPQCGEYNTNTEYPTTLTRCCKMFKGPKGFNRHKTNNHSKTWVPLTKGQRSGKMNELGFDAPDVPPRPERWLKRPSTLRSSPTVPSFSDSILLDSNLAHYDLPNLDTPVANTSYALAPYLNYSAPPTSSSGSNNTYTPIISAPSWQGSRYGNTYPTDQDFEPQPSYSLSTWSNASTSRSPSYWYSPSNCSSIGDSFPPSPGPIIDSNSYDFSLLESEYDPPTEVFNNFRNEPVVPFPTDPTSGYPCSDSDFSAVNPTLASYPASLSSQYPLGMDCMYSSLGYDNSSFDNHQFSQFSTPYFSPL